MKNLYKLFALNLLILIASCKHANNNSEQFFFNINNNKGEKMKTMHLTKADFLAKIVNYETNPDEWKYLGDKPSIIDFYASWCGPCKTMTPVLEELAAEYENRIYIYKINIEQEIELASIFNINSVPTFLFIPMNDEPQIANGAMSKADLTRAIQNVLLKN
ncbi:MAG: thioredoxin fold domain-containing protein [Prevotellaceae bacterium]|jgi:thioredoxin|nr:thioredoxin fold domain-containing protein [Prevotellaceae bacterium]